MKIVKVHSKWGNREVSAFGTFYIAAPDEAVITTRDASNYFSCAIGESVEVFKMDVVDFEEAWDLISTSAKMYKWNWN